MIVRSGVRLHCRFRGCSPIAALKAGPRGGVLALHEGKWKRVRKTRAKQKEPAQ